MAFDINSWKDQLSAKLPGWRARMQAGGVTSAYYFIAASALFPIIQVAQKGDWSALVSLGTVLGGAVGTNLLANLVQNLKNKTDVEVAKTLQSEAQSSPELKTEMDALLEKLDALHLAEHALSEEDKRWFVGAINQELAQLKSSVTYTVTATENSNIDGVHVIGNKNIVNINVQSQSPTLNETDHDPKIFKGNRVLDAAISKTVVVGNATKLLAMVRQTESGGLFAFFDLEENEFLEDNIKSKSFQIEFPITPDGDLLPGEILLKLISPDFAPEEQYKKILVPVNGDSEVCTFLLKPTRIGKLLLNLEVFKGDIFIASRNLITNGVSIGLESGYTLVISIPLTVVATREFVKQKSGIRYNATLNGNGAIAQGNGAVGLGKHAILIQGDVKGDFIQTQVIGSAKPAPSSHGDETRRYLECVAAEANLLPWKNVTAVYADPTRGESLDLTDVYIDLDTNQMRHMTHEEEMHQFLAHQQDAARISAQEMVNREPRLLMMGDPGSGKSTFVKHLAYLMAKACLAKDDPAPWLDRLRGWKHGALLPVRLELRQVISGAAQSAKGARLLLNHLRAELGDWDLEAFWEPLQSAIKDSNGGVLFLLDGLDEVPTTLRQVVVDAVNALCALYPKHRYVVTCRPYAYVGQPWTFSQFHDVTLAPFSKEQIDRFVDNWYARLAERGRIEKLSAVEKAHRLKEAVHRRDLLGLAERPLLLTVMAQLNAYAGQLPEDRTQLFADAVQLLLQRWESRLDGQKGILEYLDIPGLKMSDLETGLYNVAFRAHSASTSLESTADISEGNLREWLCCYLNNDWNKAGEFVTYIRERAGLLVHHKTDAYTFPHRSFQDFLAACYWLSMEDYPSKAVEFLRGDWERWREVFVLSAGYAARSKRLGHAISAVNLLLPRALNEMPHPQGDDWRAATLAAQALVEIGLVGVRREEAGRSLLERAQLWLVAALENDQDLKPTERAEAGRLLGKLGDTRKEVLTCEHMIFCHVPSGVFLFGDEIEEINLPHDFWVGKYPVTNAQYRQFVAAGGYTEARYWQEAIAANRWIDGKITGFLDKIARMGALDFGEPYSLPNYPVVGVTWYEAQAFTRWLSEKSYDFYKTWKVEHEREEMIFKQGLGSKTLGVFLPGEEQWEKAARGTDGRNYPWGEKPDKKRANFDKTGINTTNAVGCFPGGISPFGALEMAGNVFEWTSMVDGPKHKLRGGAFDLGQDFSRCAYHLGDEPSSWDLDLGFRVVVSPIPLS